ncbi:MAG: alkyl/aryl-sulfatase [Lachnospiraceae bacterium]|jgi:alkyl sulfatase BDS1-like metallo-beta-lactamase superfamily hydrolase|nr:alkyl/aryl-sulfatase [Lachnospiraceae bacterium]
MTGEKKLKDFTEKNYQKTLTKVNDHIYHFLGYGISNAVAVLGETSVILIDALDSTGYGEELKEDLARLTDKPVKTIIYTHGHPDHRGGAGVFRDTVEEVIAFAPKKPVLKYYDRLKDVLNQRGAYQFGYGLTDEETISQGIGIREGWAVGKGSLDFIAPTTMYHEDEVERVIDGVKLKMVSAAGETDDQIFVWLEEDQVICTGDNYYGCWPNLYAIRGTQYRDIAAWADTLGVILSYDAKALLPGHTRPIMGREQIQDQIGTFRDAIEYVLLETLDCMNKGMTISETTEQVKLPEKYLDKEYLGEFYGTVEWSVKSIYCGYVGWFDGNAAGLMPVSDREYQAVIRELIGDEKLKEKIKEYMNEGQFQIALQLLELADGKESSEYRELKKEALLKRAGQMTSANARHYFIASAKNLG